MTDEFIEAKKRAWALCGTTNLIQAFDQIEDERLFMLTLHDKNQALKIHIHRIADILRTTETIIESIEETGMMFQSNATRNAIERYKELYADIEERLQEALKL